VPSRGRIPDSGARSGPGASAGSSEGGAGDWIVSQRLSPTSPISTLAQHLFPSPARTQAGRVGCCELLATSRDWRESAFPHELSREASDKRLPWPDALAPGLRAVICSNEPFSNLDVDVRLRLRGELHGVLAAAASGCDRYPPESRRGPARSVIGVGVRRVRTIKHLNLMRQPLELVHEPARCFLLGASFMTNARHLCCRPLAGRAGCLTPLGWLEPALPGGKRANG